MTNPVLTKFFADTSIDKQKRVEMLGQLQRGANEMQLASQIQSQYYGQQQPSQARPSNSLWQGAKEVAKIGLQTGAQGVSKIGGAALGLVEAGARYNPAALATRAFLPEDMDPFRKIGDTIGGVREAGQQGINQAMQQYERDTPTGSMSLAGRAGQAIVPPVLSTGAEMVATLGLGAGKAAARAGSFLGSLAKNPTLQKVGSVLGSSAAFTGIEAGKRGELPSVGDLGVGAAIDSAVAGVTKLPSLTASFADLIKRSRSGLSKASFNVVKEAAELGLAPNLAKELRTATSGKKSTILKLLETSENFAIHGKGTTALGKISRDYFTKGIQKLNYFKQQAGRTIGAEKAKNLQTQGVNTLGRFSVDKETLQKTMKSFYDSTVKSGVQFKNGKPDFSNSLFRSNATAQKEVGGLLKTLEKVSKDPKNAARELQIKLAELDDMLDPMWKNSKGSSIDKSLRSVLTEGRRNLNEILVKNNPALAAANKVFSKLKPIVQDADDKTKAAFESLKKGNLTGVEAETLLRRSLGAGKRQYDEFLNELTKVGKEFKVPELAAVKNWAKWAQAADDMFSVDTLTRPASFAGRITEAGKAVTQGNLAGAASNIGQAAKSVSEALSPSQLKNLRKALSPEDQGFIKGIADNPLTPVVLRTFFQNLTE